MKAIDFFNETGFLEPRCKGCEIKLDYGVNTEWSDEAGCHVCKKCGAKVE